MMKTKVYTMQDWCRDGELTLSVGQLVHPSVIYELRDCVPPTYWSHNYFQVGEPKDNDPKTGGNLYDTFKRLSEDSDTWKYLGTCLYGQTEHRKGFYA